MLKISLMEGSGWYSFQPPQRVDQAARPVHFLSAVYTVALGLLTEAAVNGGLLTHETVRCYRETSQSSLDDEGVPVDHVLYSLEHDGYLEGVDGGYGFVSGLLEDWWRARHGQYFTPIIGRC